MCGGSGAPCKGLMKSRGIPLEPQGASVEVVLLLSASHVLHLLTRLEFCATAFPSFLLFLRSLLFLWLESVVTFGHLLPLDISSYTLDLSCTSKNVRSALTSPRRKQNEQEDPSSAARRM